MLLISSLLTSFALAQTNTIFPTQTSTLQDDASTIWTNPANFAFAPYLTKIYAVKLTDTNNSFAFARQMGILGLGVHYANTEQTGAWWSVSSALSLKLDKHLSFGTTNTWNSLEKQNDSFTKWDVGLGWRPLHWIGFGANINNIGSPQTSLTPERLMLGTGLSTAQNRLQLGVDYVSNSTDVFSTMGNIQTTLRVRPTQGVSVQVQSTNFQDITGGISIGYGYGEIGGYGSNTNEFTMVHTSGINDTSVVARGRRVAYFNLDNSIQYEQTSGFLQGSSGETYFSLLNRIHQACMDPAVKGIFVDIDAVPLSLAQVDEIRTELLAARQRGKTVLVYLDGSADNKSYYLATAASEIYAHPAGSVEIIGLHSERMYLKGLFEQVGIEPEFVKRAAYKSAPEQYTNTTGSDASKEQSTALLDDMFGLFVGNIADARGISKETVLELVNNAPFSTEQATQKGLVDKAVYDDEMEDILDDKFGIFHRLEGDYGYERPDGWSTNSEIAVIGITGVIMPGKSQTPGVFGGEFTAGSETIVGQLHEAAEDSAVKAIVIRVDSPGGSAFASDQIWRAVSLAKKEKPVIISMGGVAASGGYYVSAGADAIFAEASTITGSIGVYSGKFNAQGLLAMLHVNVESEDRGENAALYSTFQPWTESQRAKMEEQVELTYQQFKTVVSTGRSLDMDAVEKIAQGHVWSGSKALEIGLVDKNGGLFDAIQYAQEKANIRGEQIRLVQYEALDSSSFYKYEMAVEQAIQNLQNPLAKDIQWLNSLSGEHMWMLSDIATIR